MVCTLYDIGGKYNGFHRRADDNKKVCCAVPAGQLSHSRTLLTYCITVLDRRLALPPGVVVLI